MSAPYRRALLQIIHFLNNLTKRFLIRYQFTIGCDKPSERCESINDFVMGIFKNHNEFIKLVIHSRIKYRRLVL